MLRPIGRHAQRVLCVVEAGRGVRVRADAEADRRQEVVDGLPREMPRALELHVLDEMRETALVVVFQHGSSLHDQSQFGLARGPGIRPDVEAEAVGQAADQHLRIDGHVGRKRVARHRCSRCLAAGARGLRGQLTGSNEQTDHEAGGRTPEEA